MLRMLYAPENKKSSLRNAIAGREKTKAMKK